MKQGSPRFPRWLIPSTATAALAFSVLIYIYLSFTSAHQPPRELVISACRDIAPGMRRVDSDFGIQFDLSEKDFTVRSELRDMPPGKLFLVTPKGYDANMVIWRDDNIFNELKTVFPTFSEHIGERDIRTSKGQLVGKDRWGYLKDGERWRYLTFSRGDALGYRPVRPKEASLLDQVISSACVLPGPGS